MNPREQTDYDGLGQSGYTAGRTRDAALDRDVITEYPPLDEDGDEGASEDNGTVATDDRFTGRSRSIKQSPTRQPDRG